MIESIFALMFASVLPILAAAFLFFIFFDDWLSFCKDNPRIRFKAFLTFYSIAPDKWNVYRNYVSYHGGSDFGFSIIDWLRYKHWRKHKEKWETKQQQNAEYLRTIELIKKDLESFTIENDKMIAKEVDKLNKMWR